MLNDMGRLHGVRVPPQVAAVQDYFRDVADLLARVNSSIDGLRDTIGTAVRVNLSLVTINDGEVTKRLAAWAAIFAVWTSFAGLWGMNFEHMPELKWTYGYPLSLCDCMCMQRSVLALQAHRLVDAASQSCREEKRFKLGLAIPFR